MKIIVASDTHGSSYEISLLAKIISGADIFIHLGDNNEDVDNLTRFFHGQTFEVRGNCDYFSSVPLERIEVIGNKRIFITHGHKYGVKTSYNTLLRKAKELKVDMVLFGHTHLAELLFEDGIWMFNPGSPSMGRNGFSSYGEINILDGEIVPLIKALVNIKK
ncbi:MAG TPA: metallophosphoesterase [Clostridiaceae bacterium]